MGPFRENDIQDIYLGIQGINSGQSTKGKPYSTATRSDLIQTVEAVAQITKKLNINY